MRYPLWLRVAIQNGNILYPDIVQKRYETSLTKRYKNNFKISSVLSDVIVVPEQYRLGNYFCDFYYNNEDCECVFSEYKFSENKKVEVVRNLDYKLRMDHNIVEKFKEEFPDRDELIIYSGHMGVNYFRNGLQSNLLFWDKTFWYSYSKPDFMTAELEQLVQEKRVRLLDVPGMEEITKIMFVNEFEPFDLNRALPVNNSTITNYHSLLPKYTLPRLKVLLFLILFFIFFFYCVVSPSFEFTTYPYELYHYLYYPVIALSIMLVFILAKRNHFKTMAIYAFTKLYIWGISISAAIILSIFLLKGVILPYGGKLYTLLKSPEYHDLVITNSVESKENYSNYQLYGERCNYLLQLTDNSQDKHYDFCSSKDKNELLKYYEMEIQESKFGYHIKQIQPKY